MSIEKLNKENLKTVAALADRPQLPAKELKAAFDNNASLIADFINDTLIPEINKNTEFAKDISEIVLKGNATGSVVTLTDISPLIHTIKAQVITDSEEYNLLTYPYPIKVFTTDGITVSMNDEDKSITINGTPTRSLALQIFKGEMYLKGKYTLGGVDNSDGDGTPYIQAVVDGIWKKKVESNPLEYELDGTLTDVKLFLIEGYTYNNEIARPWLIKSDKLDIKLSEVKLIRYGAYDTDKREEYSASDDGFFYIESLFPITTVTSDIGDLKIVLEYNRDIVKAINEIYGRLETFNSRITKSDAAEYEYIFSTLDNCDVRLTNPEISKITFTFPESFSDSYCAGLSFTCKKGVSINYSNNGIIEWFGVDCLKENGKSVFSPVAGKHYDITFMWNGFQLVGSINGYIPSTVYNNGNAVS